MFKIVKSLLIIAAVGAIATSATGAYFSDTESVVGNTFAAGSIDLQIDQAGSVPFNVGDVAPGQTGTKVITLTNATGSLDASLDVKISNFLQFENSLLEPETHPGYGTADYENGPNAGELNFFLGMVAYLDVDKDNTFDAGDFQLAYNGQTAAYPGFWGGDFHYAPVSSNLTGWNDITTLTGGQSVNLVIMWQVPTQSSDGNYSQNIAMSDSLSFDVLTSLEQTNGSGGVTE